MRMMKDTLTTAKIAEVAGPDPDNEPVTKEEQNQPYAPTHNMSCGWQIKSLCGRLLQNHVHTAVRERT